jgi:hypothetical protein
MPSNLKNEQISGNLIIKMPLKTHFQERFNQATMPSAEGLPK